MGIVSQERFVQAMAKSDRMRQQAVASMNRGYGDTQGLRERIAVDREAALEVYGKIKEYIGHNGWLPAKYLRPWELDDQLYARLDRKEPWWGFEFETGYRSTAARKEVIDHVWDTWDNVVFDSEGEGAAAVEITFAPQEMSKYLNGTADSFKFVEYLTNNPRVMKGNSDAIGTHINFSHPLLTPQNISMVTYGLQRTVAVLPSKVGDKDVRLDMFGRSHLYGGFFTMAAADAVWIEGKLFRTTYDIATFKRYVKVCEALTKCMEVLCNTPSVATKMAYVTNLYEVCFDGAKPIVDFSTAQNIDGTRSNGLLNGPLARGNPPPPKQVPRVVEQVDNAGEYPPPPDGIMELPNGDRWCGACGVYH